MQVAAKSNAPFAVCFNLVDSFHSAGKRQFGWMLRGLKEVEAELKTLDIPMFLLRGEHAATIPGFARAYKAGLVVVDFCPLRVTREWRDNVADTLGKEGISVRFYITLACKILGVARGAWQRGNALVSPALLSDLHSFLACLQQSPLRTLASFLPLVRWQAFCRTC